MLTIDDQIRDLRAELADCALTPRERVQAKVDLKALMVVKMKAECADEALFADAAAPA